jgi:hypothetical protein
VPASRERVKQHYFIAAEPASVSQNFASQLSRYSHCAAFSIVPLGVQEKPR